MNYDKPTAKRLRNFFLDKGLTLEGTYGLLANIYAESSFKSNNAQNSYMTKMGMTDETYTTKVDNGEYTNFIFDGVGYGLCQWTSCGRKQNLLNYAKSCNKSIGDETMQLNFLMQELTGSYKAVLNILKTSRNISECAKYVMIKFERPADQSTTAQNRRANYGITLFDELENIKEEENTMANPIIGLSAGHGLYTKGKRIPNYLDPNCTREWFLNDRIMDKVEAKLKAYKCTVIRLNDTTGNVDTALSARKDKANNANVDIYLAMHHNAGAYGGAGSGTIVFYYPVDDCKEIATKLYNHIVSCTSLRGNRSNPIASTRTLYEVCKPKAKSFLIENGFMDSKIDSAIILTESHAEKTATGVVNFLVEYFKLEKSGVAVSTTVEKPSAPSKDEYEVQSGDTLTKIGKKTGVAWTTIAKLNDLKFPYTLKVGQILKLKEIVVTTPSALKGNYNLIFNAIQYANLNPDVKAAFGTNATQLKKHFESYGIKEGRKAINSFDVKVYKENNLDLQKAFGDSNYVPYFEHYMAYGYKENRKCV